MGADPDDFVRYCITFTLSFEVVLFSTLSIVLPQRPEPPDRATASYIQIQAHTGWHSCSTQSGRLAVSAVTPNQDAVILISYLTPNLKVQCWMIPNIANHESRFSLTELILIVDKESILLKRINTPWLIICNFRVQPTTTFVYRAPRRFSLSYKLDRDWRCPACPDCRNCPVRQFGQAGQPGQLKQSSISIKHVERALQWQCWQPEKVPL